MGLVITSCEICKNCKFYQSFYIKEKTRYKTVIGRCINDKKIDRHTRKISPTMDYCEFKQLTKNDTSEQRESIRKEITDMRKKTNTNSRNS